MKEFDRVMGPESIKTIFRLIGETQGEAVEDRMKKKYKITEWTLKQFAETFIEDVLKPALGADGAEYTIDGDVLTLTVKICPFLRAGISVKNQLFCTYTEGLIETAAKKAIGNIEFTPEHSIAKGNPSCVFRINIKK